MTAPRSKTIALIGDVHHEIERLDRTLALLGHSRPDLVLLTGDVGLDPPWHRAQRRTHRTDHDASVRQVLSRVQSAWKRPVAFVPGNHDLADPPDGAEGTNVDRRIVELAGLRVAGFGGAGPTRFGFPYEWTEEEAAAALGNLLSGQPRIDVLLCHTPPVDTTLDRTAGGASVGSPAVRRCLANARPRLFVCGHIHEAWGVETVEGVPCVNAGALGEPHGRAIGWTISWDEGPTHIRARVGDDAEGVREYSWRP